ncbi:cysteine desulfurase NifS [Romboutsia lituseburensis]|uniref:Cysteine desulfurase IscS n=1 Tax=Romboutsia lituseburensis DSM 797 TaxID=1121325 RepID=A0A1G9Q3X0_9FIRM|nr:cysteine desulfurase NifS [Romboutsia lituseburensis]CEH35323.1 Cysteine desulfurase [Romboutsia lituseburensis]SDM05431.1 cysteine desulfurase [Romboutsia lituseburensis DSM 797]
MEKRRLYMDYSATTPVKKEVLDAMMPYLTDYFGNASSFHTFGREAKNALDKAREQVANLVNAKPSEIYFTAGGTESDNWALEGVAFAHREKGNHIITSKIEHHGILHTCEYLEKHHGFEVTYLDVDSEGKVSLEQLEAAIKDNTILISIMFANNEIGTVQPIAEIAKIAKKHKVLFHTDAVQAAGNIPIDVKELDVDLMSMSSHKIYGPKGIGALYIKTGTKLHTFVHGGAQERRRRAGTENIPSIVGYGKAAEIAKSNMENHVKNLTELRAKLINQILEKIPYTRVNGSLDDRLPGNVNFSFEFIEGEGILLLLDMLGIAASSGSACTSGSLDPSHVLMAIGLPHEIAHGSLRLTIGDFTTEDDIDYIIEHLPAVIERLRSMSPLYDQAMKNK